MDVSQLDEVQNALVSGILDADNLLGRIDYPFFVHTVLGHDFPEIHDPTVKKRLVQTGRVFKGWLLTREKQKTFRKVMFANPRGTCKSAGTTIPLVPFAHLMDPEIACMVMSASYETMALKFADAVRQVWGGETPTSRLVDLYGQFAPKNTRVRPWSREKMVTEKRLHLSHADPTLAAYSIAKGPVSGHFNIGILDDPTTDEMMERDMNWLDKVWDAYLRLAFTLDNDALLVVICTRYDDNDIIGRIILQEIEPAVRARYGELPDDFDFRVGWKKYAHLAGWEVFYDAVYDDYDPQTRTGKIVYPVIWPQERIDEVRKTPRGERLFQSQLMNDPSGREDAPLSRQDIDECFFDNLDEVPKEAFRTIDIHCDFSFKDAESYSRQRGDFGVMHVVAKHGGHVYRIDGYRGKDTQKAFGQKLAKLVERVWMEHGRKVRYVTYEQTMGHGSGDESTLMWLHQVNQETNFDVPRFRGFPIRRMKQGNKTKLQRILDMNWAWQEGYVHLYSEAPYNDPLVYQMLNQGYSQYDDDADAFADVFTEGIYKVTRPGDLPEEVTQYIAGSGSRSWTPLPLIHCNVDQRGNVHAERRTARDPGAARPNLFGSILRRN